MRYLWIGAFVAVATAANLATAHLGLVPIGFGLSVTAGTFAAGIALVLRDLVHETSGARWAYGAVGIGAVLTAVTAGPMLALASAAAFAVSEGADAVVYTRARRRSRSLAILASGAVGLVLDTVLFLWIAGFPLTWGTFIGQAIVKGAVTLLAAAVVAARTAPRIPVRA
jgi:uncharacterized PurR-regulated membrane protein YhhQ (DUF165 family)